MKSFSMYSFCVWLLSLNGFWESSIFLCVVVNYSFSLLHNIVSFEHTTVFLFYCWRAFGWFLVWGYYKQHCNILHMSFNKYMYAQLFCTYLWTELSGHKVCKCCSAVSIAKQFFMAVALIYILASFFFMSFTIDQ